MPDLTRRTRMETGNPLPSALAVTATLRFIKERLAGGSGDQHECFETYTDEKPATTDPGGITVRFPLSEGDYETELSAINRRYWQVRLKTNVEGDHFDESFIVPVYRRP